MNQIAALTTDGAPRAIAPHSMKPTAAPVAVEAAGNHLDAILRAARDPSVDMGKMERLISVHRDMMKEEIQRSFTRAKIAMRPEIPKVEKRGEIVIYKKDTQQVIQSTPFAKFEDIHDAVMPVLIAHGFDLDYRTGTREGRVVVTAVLSHVDGHREETSLDGPLDTSGSKNNVQGVGSTLSYLKRYTMCALLNIRTADKGEFDDDGIGSESAKASTAITEKQVDELRREMRDRRVDEAKFCEFAGVARIEDVPAVEFESTLVKVKMKKKTSEASHVA